MMIRGTCPRRQARIKKLARSCSSRLLECALLILLIHIAGCDLQLTPSPTTTSPSPSPSSFCTVDLKFAQPGSASVNNCTHVCSSTYGGNYTAFTPLSSTHLSCLNSEKTRIPTLARDGADASLWVGLQRAATGEILTENQGAVDLLHISLLSSSQAAFKSQSCLFVDKKFSQLDSSQEVVPIHTLWLGDCSSTSGFCICSFGQPSFDHVSTLAPSSQPISSSSSRSAEYVAYAIMSIVITACIAASSVAIAFYKRKAKLVPVDSFPHPSMIPNAICTVDETGKTVVLSTLMHNKASNDTLGAVSELQDPQWLTADPMFSKSLAGASLFGLHSLAGRDSELSRSRGSLLDWISPKVSTHQAPSEIPVFDVKSSYGRGNTELASSLNPEFFGKSFTWNGQLSLADASLLTPSAGCFTYLDSESAVCQDDRPQSECSIDDGEQTPHTDSSESLFTHLDEPARDKRLTVEDPYLMPAELSSKSFAGTSALLAAPSGKVFADTPTGSLPDAGGALSPGRRVTIASPTSEKPMKPKRTEAANNFSKDLRRRHGSFSGSGCSSDSIRARAISASAAMNPDTLRRLAILRRSRELEQPPVPKRRTRRLPSDPVKTSPKDVRSSFRRRSKSSDILNTIGCSPATSENDVSCLPRHDRLCPAKSKRSSRPHSLSPVPTRGGDKYRARPRSASPPRTRSIECLESCAKSTESNYATLRSMADEISSFSSFADMQNKDPPYLRPALTKRDTTESLYSTLPGMDDGLVMKSASFNSRFSGSSQFLAQPGNLPGKKESPYETLPAFTSSRPHSPLTGAERKKPESPYATLPELLTDIRGLWSDHSLKQEDPYSMVMHPKHPSDERRTTESPYASVLGLATGKHRHLSNLSAKDSIESLAAPRGAEGEILCQPRRRLSSLPSSELIKHRTVGRSASNTDTEIGEQRQLACPTDVFPPPLPLSRTESPSLPALSGSVASLSSPVSTSVKRHMSVQSFSPFHAFISSGKPKEHDSRLASNAKRGNPT